MMIRWTKLRKTLVAFEKGKQVVISDEKSTWAKSIFKLKDLGYYRRSSRYIFVRTAKKIEL